MARFRCGEVLEFDMTGLAAAELISKKAGPAVR